jgi:MYXO-CTERM domain-containing protein
VGSTCADGCRGEGGNGCPAGETCTSADATVGVCVEPAPCFVDANCGDWQSGLVCDETECKPGCRGQGGNGCPEGQVCSSTDESVGACAPVSVCADDASCGDATSGRICDPAAGGDPDDGGCVAGCRGALGNGCPAGQACSSIDDTPGVCAFVPPAPDDGDTSIEADGSGCGAAPGGARGGRDGWIAMLVLGIAAGLGGRRRRRPRRALTQN